MTEVRVQRRLCDHNVLSSRRVSGRRFEAGITEICILLLQAPERSLTCGAYNAMLMA